MRRNRVAVILPCFPVGLTSIQCMGSVRGSISYQGRLTDASGQPTGGSKSIEFRLYTQMLGGTAVWSETKTVQVTNGVFTTALGSVGNPLPESAFEGNTWLESVVEGTVLSPRTRILSTGYAFRAAVAESVPDGSIDTAKLADGAVTNPKITGMAWSKLTSVPVGFADSTDNDTLFKAGTGLLLNEVTFSLDPTRPTASTGNSVGTQALLLSSTSSAPRITGPWN